MENNVKITVAATVNAPIEKVWKTWNDPSDIMVWCTADNATWHTPSSENDLKVGGKFKTRMEAKDGTFGFDFEGEYNIVNHNKEITYTMADGRMSTTIFEEENDKTRITTTFDAEGMNSVDMQRDGWQAILNNFIKYAEQQ